MGINYGDTMALMEAFGRERIANGIVGDLARLLQAAEISMMTLPSLFVALEQITPQAAAGTGHSGRCEAAAARQPGGAGWYVH